MGNADSVVSQWNDTDGLRKHCFCNPPIKYSVPSYQGCRLPACKNQKERWWTSDQLDQKAAGFMEEFGHHGQNVHWFVAGITEDTLFDKKATDFIKPMASEVTSATRSSGSDQEWLSPSELAVLRRGEIYLAPSSGIRMSRALLISFSRRFKESVFHHHLEGKPFSQGSDFDSVWYGYLGTYWDAAPNGNLLGQWMGEYLTLHGHAGEEKLKELMQMNREVERKRSESMGTKDQLMKAMRTFSNWMWTGKVYLEEDEFVNKEYLLKLAAALGAPHFRSAILSGPILSNPMFCEPTLFSHPLAGSSHIFGIYSAVSEPATPSPNTRANSDSNTESDTDAESEAESEVESDAKCISPFTRRRRQQARRQRLGKAKAKKARKAKKKGGKK